MHGDCSQRLHCSAPMSSGKSSFSDRSPGRRSYRDFLLLLLEPLLLLPSSRRGASFSGVQTATASCFMLSLSARAPASHISGPASSGISASGARRHSGHWHSACIAQLGTWHSTSTVRFGGAHKMDLHSAQSKMMCLWHKMARRTAISERVPLVDAFFSFKASESLQMLPRKILSNVSNPSMAPCWPCIFFISALPQKKISILLRWLSLLPSLFLQQKPAFANNSFS